MLDRRRNPWRSDLAAASLQGKVNAAQFVEGEAYLVAEPILDLFMSETCDRLGSQLLYGEPFTVYDTDRARGLAWGQSGTDGYVGYARLEGLTHGGESGNQRLTAPFTPVFSAPDIKAPVTQAYPFLSRVSVSGSQGDLAKIETGWVHQRHIAPIAGDMVAFAEAFIGAPYLWGGRSWLGLDCSALVQLAANAFGVDCPRDSDMQEAELGKALSQDAALRRGDLIFWEGHVGLMIDEETLLHANAYHMATVAEPLSRVVSRISAAGGGQIRTIRRI